MIRNIALAISVLIIAGCFFYITSQNKYIDSLIKSKLELSQQVTSLKRQVMFQEDQLKRTTLLYKEYVEKVNKIKSQVRTITVYRDIVKEVPAEIVIQKANEDSNEIIDSIVLGAINFNRMYNTETSTGTGTSSGDTSGSSRTSSTKEAGVAISTN